MDSHTIPAVGAAPVPATSLSAQAAAKSREAEREQLRKQWRERDEQRLMEAEARSGAARETIESTRASSRSPARSSSRSPARGTSRSPSRSPMRDRKFSSEQLSHISPDVAKATAAARAKSKAHRAASDALDASVLAAAAGQGDWEAQKRGLRRGAAFLEWLHSDVDARPIAPLDDYRYEFDEELAAKAMRKEASEEANAAAVKQARDNDAHTIAQRALQARRLNKQMNRPPPGLGALDRRLWAAYCEHETDEVGGGLTKMGFDAAFAAAGLMAETSQTANARWRRAELAKSGRVVWVEFRRLGNQLKALEELNQTEAAAARENKRVATDLAAASAIQARVRGNATREQTDAAILERRRAEQRMLTDEQTRARYESAYGIKGASVPTAAFAADTYGSAALARPGDGGSIAPVYPTSPKAGLSPSPHKPGRRPKPAQAFPQPQAYAPGLAYAQPAAYAPPATDPYTLAPAATTSSYLQYLSSDSAHLAPGVAPAHRASWPILPEEPPPFKISSEGTTAGSEAVVARAVAAAAVASAVAPAAPLTRQGSINVPDHMMHLQQQPLRLPQRTCGPHYSSPAPPVKLTPTDQLMATKAQAAQRAKLGSVESQRRRAEMMRI